MHSEDMLISRLINGFALLLSRFGPFSFCFFRSDSRTPTSYRDSTNSPSYAYQIFYFYANLRVLNQLRAARGFNTFTLRPHCGEAGDTSHLATAYLCVNGISHGINLRKSRTLQFLYYLDQIGIAVSPVSNNFLFLKLDQHPFLKALNLVLISFWIFFSQLLIKNSILFFA